MQPLGDVGQRDERVPREAVDRLGVDPVSVRHHEVDVVAAGAHPPVDQHALGHRLPDEALAQNNGRIFSC